MPKFLDWLELYKMIKLENREEKAGAGTGFGLPNSNKFAGMVIVFTGIRNADMEKAIVDGAGVIGSGITGKTTLVVAKDTSENTGKIKTAREKGIQLMNIDDFATKYGFN